MELFKSISPFVLWASRIRCLEQTNRQPLHLVSLLDSLFRKHTLHLLARGLQSETEAISNAPAFIPRFPHGSPIEPRRLWAREHPLRPLP